MWILIRFQFHQCYVRFRYDACGTYIIRARVRNLLTTGDWEEFLQPHYNGEATIQVVCNVDIDQVDIFPFPVVQKGDTAVWVSRTRPLLLNIHARVGSYLNFIVFWGDGTQDVVDHSKKLVSSKFQVRHTYGQIGIFNVTLTIKDPSLTIHKSAGIVNVTECGPPLVLFNYGTKDKPELYPISNDKIITGVWFIEANCSTEVESFFKVDSWRLLHRKNGSIFREWVDKPSKSKKYITKYWIKKGSLPLGEYRLELSMIYNKGSKEIKEIYKGFLNVVRSFLELRIINGIEASVPSKTLKQGNFTYYGFELDASISFDPDNKKEGITGMEFKWFCRVVSTERETQESIEHQKEHDDIPEKYLANRFCLHRDWREIPESREAKINLHTAMLLEHIRYDFKVEVTKGDRSGGTIQRLTILEGATPLVKIV